MTAQQIVDRMKAEGVVSLGGEMDFPVGLTCREAYRRAADIAEACGYLVGYHHGQSALCISGGDIPGYVVLDWFDADRPGPEKVELWSADAAYAA